MAIPSQTSRVDLAVHSPACFLPWPPSVNSRARMGPGRTKRSRFRAAGSNDGVGERLRISWGRPATPHHLQSQA